MFELKHLESLGENLSMLNAKEMVVRGKCDDQEEEIAAAVFHRIPLHVAWLLASEGSGEKGDALADGAQEHGDSLGRGISYHTRDIIIVKSIRSEND
jgi:hypothetical protein